MAMDELVKLTQTPKEKEIYMIAGWRQWADAGSVSSALPPYLVNLTHAEKIGEVKSDPFYVFQVPGTQALFRPEIKLDEGYTKELKEHKNEIHYAVCNGKGLVIISGDEPQLNVQRYAEVFFGIAKELRVQRVVAVGGIYAAVPYDKDRQMSCTYSLKTMKAELERYAVRFSSYEGGVSIGSYLASKAEKMGMEYVGLYAFVPMYDLTSLVPNLAAVGIDEDYKAWNDLTRRLNHMFNLGLDLSDLEKQSEKLISSMAARIDELEKKMPQARIKEFLKKFDDEFTEMSFAPMDVWEDGLKDLFGEESN
jgi:proteasome assembly chaperone (PAC2) family protein